VSVDIEDLIRAIGEGKVLITDHADEEAQADDLSFDEVYFSVVHGEIIEEYPEDRPYPSCLVYGDTFGGEPVHSVWAYNEESGFAAIITVYRPDPTRWKPDWKTRRRQR
jgi:Domain of unknown function (DUF4258)